MMTYAVIDCQVLSRDRHRRRLPVDDDVTVPALPALVHASQRLRSSTLVHYEESHCSLARRYTQHLLLLSPIAIDVSVPWSVCLSVCLTRSCIVPK